MKTIIISGLIALAATSANACVVNEDSFFKGPGCIIVNKSGAIVGYGSQYTPATVSLPTTGTAQTEWNRSDNGIGGVTAPTSVTRNYALGDEPGVGKKGKQSLPLGLREVSRRTLSQSLAPRSKLTGPAVHTDPVTGAKSLKSVEVTYSNSRSTSRGSTSGPGQQR